MKAMKFFLLIFQLSILIGMYSCKKDTPPVDQPLQLPPETQTGENTFGCLVNGEVWLPKGGGFNYALTADYYNSTLIIDAKNTERNDYINLNAIFIYSDTSFIIINNDSQYFYYAKGLNFFYPDSLRTGSFNLKKLDPVNHIMSGTFWFDAINTSNNEIVQIRDGRFDVKY